MSASDDTTDAVAEARLLINTLRCDAALAPTREVSEMHERAADTLEAQLARIDDLEAMCASDAVKQDG